jgi:molybdopterin converting factor small subunit
MDKHIKVKIIYTGMLRQISGKDEELVELKTGSKGLDLLLQLVKKYGKDFEKYIFYENKFNETTVFILNGITIQGNKLLNYSLCNGDTLHVLIPVFGG